MNVDATDSDDGLSIVLSPVQLAAVMQGQSISLAEGTTGNFLSRIFGGLEMVGGAIELVGAAGLLLAPEPTAVTKVGGVALGANGADNAVTGAIELWTGRATSTLTERAAAAAARSLGCDPDTAGKVGLAVDIAVPLVTAFGLGAARAMAIRGGTIDLAAEEAAGGHTIAKHVGKDEAFLRNRLATERVVAAGTFRRLKDAEKFVSRAVAANSKQIENWANSSRAIRGFQFEYDAKEVVGTVIPRSTGTLQKSTKIVVVLRKTIVGKKIYFILTAFPSL